MNLNLGEWLVIGLSAFLFAWYLFWNAFNRRRGIAAYYWLRRFLESTGEVSDARWLGASSSGARLAVARGEKPFRQVEAVYWLESRDLLPMWIFHLLRGRQEEALIRASLQPTPKQTLEVGRLGERGFQSLLAGGGYSMGEEPLLGEYRAAWAEGEISPDLKPLEEFLAANHGAIGRVSLRKKSPHLEIRLGIKPLLALSPDKFLESLQSFLADYT